MPFLSMIVMIKGIYLITGLLNYSSVEARLFRRMLIALRSPRHLLAFICLVPLGAEDQRFVKTATKDKIGKKKKKEEEESTVLVLKGGLPGTWLCAGAAVSSPLSRQGHQGSEVSRALGHPPAAHPGDPPRPLQRHRQLGSGLESWSHPAT